MARSAVSGSHGSCRWSFQRNRDFFQSDCAVSYSHQQLMSDPVILHPCQHFAVTFFYFSYCDRPVGLSHHGFNLHFHNGWWCLRWLPSHLCLFFDKMCLCVFCSSSNYILCFYIDKFWEFAICSHTSPFLDMWLANILSHFVVCLFVFFTGLVQGKSV